MVSWTKHTAEEIVAELRQVDVLVSQGRKVADAIRSIEVTGITYHRRRSEYGGLKGDQMRNALNVLSDPFSLRGVQGHVRSDNGPEFIAKALRDRIAAVGSQAAHIEPGSPWENGYCESFNAKLRNERLDGGVFYTLKEAGVVLEQGRMDCNTIRPRSSLGYQPPAPQVVIWPPEPSGSAPVAHLAIVTRPTMH